MCIYTGRYLCSTRATANCMPLRDAEENLGQYLKNEGYDPVLFGYNDYALDPGILPDEDERKHRLDYANLLPGFRWGLKHEYDSPEYFESLRKKGYPEKWLNHKEIHKPDMPPEGPGEHLDCAFPARYKCKEDSECYFLTDKTMDYIQDQAKRRKDNPEKPGWVLSLNYIKPHPPNVACQEFLDLYKLDEMPEPLAEPGELNPGHPYLKYFMKKHAPKGQQLKEFQACYYAMISEVDYNVGRLLDFLEAKDLKKDTLILFTSDHGEYLGDHYQTGKKLFFDQTMRVPYIVFDPSQKSDATRGKILDDFVESIDSTPTLLEMLDLPVPARIQGRSLKKLLCGEKEDKPKTEIHFEIDYRYAYEADSAGRYPLDKSLWAIRDHDYKMVQFSDLNTPPLLYDLKKDPAEMKNIAEEEASAAILLKYSQKLIKWRMQNEDQRLQEWFDGVKKA